MMGFEEVIGWEYSYGQVGINSTIFFFLVVKCSTSELGQFLHINTSNTVGECCSSFGLPGYTCMTLFLAHS